jgi:serine/threonine-protein kinase RsbW
MRTHFIQSDLVPHGSISYGSGSELSMVIPADVAAMEQVTARVNKLLAARQWPVEEIMKVELAVQEALANAIRHGCRNDASKQVHCCVALNAGELGIVVSDPGPGFDVKAVADPLQGANLFKPSGRGVFLINRLMDAVEFTDGGRQVLMRKRLRRPAVAAKQNPS